MSKAVSEVNEKIEEETRQESALWEWTKTIVYAIVLALFIRTFFLQTFKIPTGSMEPTLHGANGRGDKIVVLKFVYGFQIPFTDKHILPFSEPKAGDVVVFKTKGIEGVDQGKDFIKRVIGVGGDRVQIVPDEPIWDSRSRSLLQSGGHIYINGKRLEQPASIADRTYYLLGQYGEEEITVPKDSYFVLGDNSTNSKDSRYWGYVPRKNILGKAVAIYWPPRRMGSIQ